MQLPSAELRASFVIPAALAQVAWSPDGRRLIALPIDHRKDTVIIDIGSRKITPIGRLTNTISSSDQIYWTEQEWIYFVATQHSSDRFSLETLSSEFLGHFDDASFDALRARLSKSPTDHEHVVVRVRAKQGPLDLSFGQAFEVANRDGSFVQVLGSEVTRVL